MLAFAVSAAMGAGASRTLVTQNYTVTITEQCDEYEVGCGKVLYHSISGLGKAITLRGKQIMAMCKDGVTPCHPLGYRFLNKGVTYNISESGELTVTRGKATLLNEQGKWNDN